MTPLLPDNAPLATIAHSEQEKALRKKTTPFDPTQFKKGELQALVRTMRKIMKHAQGIGLSANQVGLDLNFCIVEPPTEATGNKRVMYALGNLRVVKRSEEMADDEEGCLSVPGLAGMVSRYDKITVEGIDIQGKKTRVKAWGLLARIFQHEMDHLQGGLFIDKAKEVHEVSQEVSHKK